VHAIDRRSDVYSLGATLYELLTGSVPFPAASLVTALARVLHDDPPAPRSLVPGLPVDLETIVLKCLAKDPAQRYPTARALADDLGRHLDGQPILGRRPTLWQRLRLPPRVRHRRALAVVACAVAVELGVASLGVGACLGSRTNTALAENRTRLAGQLGQQTKEIELSLRSAYQLPLHDTRADRDHVRAQMRAIAAAPHGLGALGDAFVHDALGRGHFALHEWREAADELGRAAAAGLQTPELHAELGRALGVRYRAELEAARRSDDKAGLAARQRELEAQYLTPALAELAQSRSSGEDAGLLDAQIAFDRHELAAAEQRALAATERSPGFYEARKLAADAAYEGAVEAFDRGDDDLARTGLERAAALYERVSEIARSDASVYEAAADTWLSLAKLDVRQGRSPVESLECALDLVDSALRADPDDGPAYTIKVYVLLRWYRTPSLYGVDERLPLLDRIAQAAERAVELDPGCPCAWRALGAAYTISREGPRAPWWPGQLHELGELLALWPDDPGQPDRDTAPHG
jgi:serine/threonine-protein kinase